MTKGQHKVHHYLKCCGVTLTITQPVLSVLIEFVGYSHYEGLPESN